MRNCHCPTALDGSNLNAIVPVSRPLPIDRAPAKTSLTLNVSSIFSVSSPSSHFGLARKTTVGRMIARRIETVTGDD